MSDEFGSIAQCATWFRDISTEDSLPIRWWLYERKDEITFWSRAYESGFAVPRGGIGKNIGCAPRERCRSEPRGAPSPLFYLRHFLARCLTLDPRSLLNRTDALATQAMADRESVVGIALKKKGSVEDRESGVAPCHGVALKKKKGHGPREQFRSVRRGGDKEEKRKK